MNSAGGAVGARRGEGRRSISEVLNTTSLHFGRRAFECCVEYYARVISPVSFKIDYFKGNVHTVILSGCQT